MFTADNVLGIGTSVFKDLHVYLASLRRMAEERPGRLYPGHGPCVEDGGEKIAEYIQHRMRRVTQVVDLLSDTFAGGGGSSTVSLSDWSIEHITRKVYTGLAEQLIFPAMTNTRQVLHALQEDGVVVRDAETDTWRLSVSVEDAYAMIGASSKKKAKM